MKKIILVFCFGILCSPAFAQSSSEGQAIDDLMEVLNFEKQLEQSAERMFDMQVKAMPQIAQFKDVMMDFFDKHVTWDKLGDDIKSVYADLFTEQEVRDLIAFYKTPTGKKMVEKMPALQARLAQVSQQAVLEHRAELQQKIRTAMQNNMQ